MIAGRPQPPARARTWRDERGVLVVGTLVKTLLWLSLLGIVGYDCISLATTQVTVRNDAEQAASVGSDVLHETGDPAKAYAAVAAFARAHGDVMVPTGFSTGPHSQVTVQLRRTAKTILTAHLPKVSSYVVSDATASSSYPLS